MFLKSIHIKNYNQFKNLELDLTYPKGHAKAGEPLEKICIIGDNGTGKTTILKLIRDYYWYISVHKTVNNPHDYTVGSIDEIGPDMLNKMTRFIFNNSDNEIGSDKLNKLDAKLIYFPDGHKLLNLRQIIENKELPRSNPKPQPRSEIKLTTKSNVKFTRKSNVTFGKKKHESSNVYWNGVYNLDDSKVLENWETLRAEMKVSINKELAFRRKLLKGMNEQNEAEIDEVYKKFKAYKKKNPNGYDKLASKLNPFLRKFHLSLNDKINLDKFNEIRFLELVTDDGTVVPINELSSGIRELIFSAIPLYALNPQKGIVIMDEPEMSLYPDTQLRLDKFYRSLCSPNVQFIYATHSPILASSFEPWEVIELKFNEKGKVERKLYYEGENHVDNYHIRPMYLQWDSLFMKMFGLENDSNEVRNDMLMELAILKRDLKKSNGADKEELQKKYETLAEQLDWATL